MASFLGEIKRRKVFQVAAVYVVVGWLIIQVVDVVNEPLSLPDWFDTVVILLLAIGFPLAVILSWAYDLTPDGVVRTDVVPGTAMTSGRRLEYLLVGLLVVALGWIGYRELGPAARTARQALPNSVAVLPFENLSPDPENAYFAAGIHEETLNQLVKLSNLSVISRTSMLRYADSELTIPEIADELNVETVMEGSVRYANDRVRITAQLIDAETDEHLWSDIYERDFADVFEIQTDIAMNIANALETEFTESEQESIEKLPTDNLEAYTLYLRSLETPTVELALTYLDQAIALDPDFALAHATKAFVNTFALIGVGGGTSDDIVSLEAIVRASAQRALALDSTLGLAHAALADVHMVNWRGEAAEEAFQRAYELSPDADVLMAYGRFKRYRGEYDAAIPLLQRAVDLDPNNWIRYNQLGIAYTRIQDYAAAAETLAAGVALTNPGAVGTLTNLALTEVMRGDYDEAQRHIEIVERLDPEVGRFSQLGLAYYMMGRSEDARRMFSEFERRAAETPVREAWWVRAYVGIGDYERALQHLQTAVAQKGLADVAVLSGLAANPWIIPELDSPAFRTLLDPLWEE